jgi:hypothetical protein
MKIMPEDIQVADLLCFSSFKLIQAICVRAHKSDIWDAVEI